MILSKKYIIFISPNQSSRLQIKHIQSSITKIIKKSNHSKFMPNFWKFFFAKRFWFLYQIGMHIIKYSSSIISKYMNFSLFRYHLKQVTHIQQYIDKVQKKIQNAYYPKSYCMLPLNIWPIKILTKKILSKNISYLSPPINHQDFKSSTYNHQLPSLSSKHKYIIAIYR